MSDASSIEEAAALIALGGAHRRTERFVEAHQAYVRALEILEEELGPEHVRLARIYYSMAELELARGRFVTGESYARRSLEMCERAAGPPEVEAAENMHVLAALLAGQGRSAEGELLDGGAGIGHDGQNHGLEPKCSGTDRRSTHEYGSAGRDEQSHPASGCLGQG